MNKDNALGVRDIILLRCDEAEYTLVNVSRSAKNVDLRNDGDFVITPSDKSFVAIIAVEVSTSCALMMKSGLRANGFVVNLLASMLGFFFGRAIFVNLNFIG
jgi:hypothetical protein